MKYNKFNIMLLDGNNALSCIENYFLYGLKEQHYEYTPLFFDSFIDFKNIIYQFLEKNDEYANFSGISRLHLTAFKYNLIDLCYNTKKEFDYSDQFKFDYTMIQVKPEYIMKKYSRHLWRDDHFILVQPFGSDFFYLNDMPRDAGIISKNEVDEFYAYKTVQYSIIKKIDCSCYYKFDNLFWKTLERKNSSRDIEKILKDVLSIQMTRDIVGIVRISRKRMIQYLCVDIKNKDYLKDYFVFLERIYSKIEYMRLKNKLDYHECKKILLEVYELDNKIINKITLEKEKLRYMRDQYYMSILSS